MRAKNNTNNDGPDEKITSGLTTLDDSPHLSFTAVLDGSRQIDLYARTGVNVLGQNMNTLRQLLKNGCKFRLLFVDPESEASRHLYGENYDLYTKNVRVMMSHLSSLAKDGNNNLKIRLIDYPPSYSYFMCRKDRIRSSISLIQINFFMTRTGRDRPVLAIPGTDEWFEVFRKEFDAIWASAREVTLES